MSCIRFEHFQRSRFVQDHGEWLEFECSQGKTRRQGVRLPYRWATPSVKWGSFDLLRILKHFFTEVALPKLPFLWPAVALSAEDLWQIGDDTPFALDRKLRSGRFLEFFRGCLCRCAVARSLAATAKFNRLRRFMPTGANVLRLDPQDVQAIGSWVELPSGGQEGPKRQKLDLMSTHYSGQRHSSSMLAKQQVLRALFRNSRASLGAVSMLPVDSFLWDHLHATDAQQPMLTEHTTLSKPLPQGSPSSSSSWGNGLSRGLLLQTGLQGARGT